MSTSTSCCNGYGVEITNCIPFNTMKSFVINHMNTLESIYNETIADQLVKIKKVFLHDKDVTEADQYDWIDELDGIECLQTSQEHAYSIIANIMTHETTINFETHALHDNNPVIMLQYWSPWTYNRVESHLTEDSLVAEIEKYTTELNIPVKNIGGISVEYYG